MIALSMIETRRDTDRDRQRRRDGEDQSGHKKLFAHLSEASASRSISLMRGPFFF